MPAMPTPKPAKMPGRARASGAIEARDPPSARRFEVPARAMLLTFVSAVDTAAIEGTVRSRSMSASRIPRSRSVIALAPPSAAS